MKGLQLIIVHFLALITSDVFGLHPKNNFQRAYDSAMAVKTGYEYDIEYFRNILTWEASDMSFFTEMIADASALIETEFQGEGLRWCAEHIAYNCERNINSMDKLIRAMERDSVRLHSTVYRQLKHFNVLSEEDMKSFDYQHDRIIANALAKQDHHYYGLRDKWVEIYFAYFQLYYQLDECINSVLER